MSIFNPVFACVTPLIAWAALLAASSPAFGVHALNIIFESLADSTHPLILDGSVNLSEEPPNFDSDSSGLLTVLQEIENRFQDAFEDSQTIRITYLWDTNTSGTFSGQAPPGWVVEDNNGKITHAVVRFQPARNWFIDPTPASDSEYDMAQKLYSYGDNVLTPTQRLANFSGNVPDVFEAGYNGLADPNGPAAPDGGGNQLDLLSVAFQEVGHTLGISSGFPGNIVTDGMGNPVSGEASDGQWDVDPDFVRGNNMAMRAPGVGSNGPFAHLVGADAVMAVSLGSNERTRPSAADFFAIASTQGWTTIDLPRQDFLGGSNWSTAGNWTGNQVPGSADDAYVRSALNGSTLTAALSANVSARNLSVENGSNVDTNSFKLNIGSNVTITGLDSDIFINPGGELEADQIFIQDQSEIQMNGGLVDTRRLTIDEGTQLEGVSGGTMTIDVAERLVNNGVIDVDGGAVMTFVSAAANAWDLDGSLGNGELFANGGNLIFDTGGVTDTFNGKMTVNAGFFLRIDANWSVGSGAVLDLNGGSGGGNSARMVGGTISISGGTIDVDDVTGDGVTDGKVEFDAPVNISGGTFTVGVDDTLDFDNTANVSGGSFTLAQGASLNFDGTTSINGGTFNTFSTSLADGDVEFNGTTTWVGTTTINGIARQDGNANVVIDAVINADVFDLDGNVGSSQTWSLGADLIINADAIDTGNSTYDGTININSGSIITPASLTINLPGSNEWTMDGTLNSTGPAGGFLGVTLKGSDMNLTGTANIAGNNRWSARVDVLSTGAINIASGAALLLTGGSQVDPNTIAGGTITGLGELEAASGDALVGFGTISTPIDFNGDAQLLADNGTLVLNGSQINDVGTIGTADADGVLSVAGAWNANVAQQVRLQCGSIVGSNITNGTALLPGLITGFGTLAPSQVNNDGTIAADGGTLIINTFSAPDLDGFSGDGILEAIDGDLTIVDTVTDIFDGTATVGAGRTMTFSGGWTLSTGVLNLNGGSLPSDRAAVGGASQVLHGTTNVDHEGLFNIPTTFAASSQVNMADNDDVLRLSMDSSVLVGATFSGDGQLVNSKGATLTISDGATIDVDLQNAGTIVIGASPSSATVVSFDQTSLGRLDIEIGGLLAGSEYDQLIVSGEAILDGFLDVSLIDLGEGVFSPELGDAFEILVADSVSGSFSTENLPSLAVGLMWNVNYGVSNVVLEVGKMFSADFDVDGDVDTDDLAQWQGDFGLNGESDADADNDSDGADFLAWQRQFGSGVGLLAASTTVPEPGACLLLISGVAMAGWFRRRSSVVF